MLEKPLMYFAGGCVLVIALVLSLLGLIFLVGSKGQSPTILSGVVMLVLGLGAGGFTLRKLGKLLAATPAKIDERVLNLAAMSGGELTEGEVSGALRVSVPESEASLGRLVARGMAEHRTRGEGQVYYAFAGLVELRKVKKCPYCGGEYSLRDPQRVCPSCGANLEIVDAS